MSLKFVRMVVVFMGEVLSYQVFVVFTGKVLSYQLFSMPEYQSKRKASEGENEYHTRMKCIKHKNKTKVWPNSVINIEHERKH